MLQGPDNINQEEDQVQEDKARSPEEDGAKAELTSNPAAHQRADNITDVHSTLIPGENPTGSLDGTVLGQQSLDLREETSITQADDKTTNTELPAICYKGRRNEDDRIKDKTEDQDAFRTDPISDGPHPAGN